MSREQPKHLAASVHQRLLNISKERNEDFNLILTRYTIERLLYRLTCSTYAENFVLKGAMLMAVWMGESHRPTRDLDLLGFGDDNSQYLMQVFRQVCKVQVEEDGLIFEEKSVEINEIREGQSYSGQRIKLTGRLGNARIRIQVDIGFGDAVTPEAMQIEYPTLLNFPTPHIRAYPRETVVAEKLETIVQLGMLNSRMKDFYDLHLISKMFTFEGSILVRAIRATFRRRGTTIPTEIPIALRDESVNNPDKVTQWKAFINRNSLDDFDIDFPQLIKALRAFLLKPIQAAAVGETFESKWIDNKHWK